ncbi:MAG: NAD(P)H-binding protein, partial [Arenicella sp.]|nr:NAD(P)H-binding protein [Arenicella sp.]
TQKKVVLFGGNGFVGTHIAQQLVKHGAIPVCVSRTGSKPAHLLDQPWAEQALWLKGDAEKPDLDLLEGAAAVVALVGSPPTPTFSEQGYQRKLSENSLPNIAAISAAKAAGVNRLVLLGGHIPGFLRTDKFAYAHGKRLCLEAASDFAAASDDHGAVVLQPSGIYGIRHTKKGKSIRLDWLMKPIAKIQGILPDVVQRFIPEQLVSVEAVAHAAVRACFEQAFAGEFYIMSNREIIDSFDAT